MSESIAMQWLAEATNSANNKNLTKYMDLISKKVRLMGVPGFEELDYEDCAAQTEHEFGNNILKSVRYDGLKMLATPDAHILFKTFETIEATDGTVSAQGIEILLAREEDGIWRLLQERVLADDESRHDGLM